nr:Ger(x)C family spore germination C-terminal domain-containing protein [Paenibacillus sp. YPD9-1]
MLVQNVPQFVIDVHAKLNVSENTSDLNLAEHIDTFNTIFAQMIEKRIQLVCDKVQKELKSDIFGLGQAFYREYPAVWNQQYASQWNEKFPEAKIVIKAKVTITQTGLVGKDQNWKEHPGT